MFTGNEDVEATALREQGWSISAIARHLNRDRATIRNHLNGTRVAGECALSLRLDICNHRKSTSALSECRGELVLVPQV